MRISLDPLSSTEEKRLYNDPTVSHLIQKTEWLLLCRSLATDS